MMPRAAQVLALLSLIFLPARGLMAQESADDLAQKAANPLANLISFPIQNNTNFGIGPFERTANVLNIQPVIPLARGKVITRTIFPIVWVPDVTAEEGQLSTGLGDILFTGFYVPSSGTMTWGLGPAISIPTGGQIRGLDMWALGPSAVILAQPGSWTFGALANTIWSVGAESPTENSATGLLQYFIVRQIGSGWYVNSAPIITVDWKAEEDGWVVPFGLGAGKLIFLGKLPINMQVGAFYNVIKPEFSADWQFRVQVQTLLPTSLLTGR